MRRIRKGVNRPAYVYIITNPAWEGWCKIGKAKDVQSRLNAYQVSSPLRDYVIEFQLRIPDYIVETNIHEKLVDEGYEYRNEWFRIELQDAIELIVEENNAYIEQTQN